MMTQLSSGNYRSGGVCDLCLTGWGGADCSTDVNDCQTEACSNGGTCVDAGTNKFECLCRPGFSGAWGAGPGSQVRMFQALA